MSFTYTSKDVIMLLRYLFRVKSDAVPGRLNQFHVTLTDRNFLWAMFELCGVNHAFMHCKLLPLDFKIFSKPTLIDSSLKPCTL